jgi:FMN reductase
MLTQDRRMTEPLIVALGGTARPGSTSEMAARAVLAAVAERGARTLMFDGRALHVPHYSTETAVRTPEAVRLVEALREADAIVIASPSYHGTVSGLIKNALDYAEDLRGDTRVYFERRAVGCVVCAAGEQAIGSTLTTLRAIAHALRGWPTPLGVGINTAEGRVFDAEGRCLVPAVSEQIAIMAGELTDFTRSMGHQRRDTGGNDRADRGRAAIAAA